MELQSPRAEHGVVAGQARGADGRTGKDQRGALDARRQAPHAGLTEIPVDDHGGRPPPPRNFEWGRGIAGPKRWGIDPGWGDGGWGRLPGEREATLRNPAH